MSRDIESINQDICQQLWHREAYACVSFIVSTLCQAASQHRIEDLDEDEARELLETRRSDTEVCDDNGFTVFEFEDNWYWMEDDDHKRHKEGFKAVALHEEPELVAEVADGVWVVTRTPGLDGDSDDRDDVSDAEATEDEAWRSACYAENWGVFAQTAYDDEEEAAGECMYDNRLDPEYDTVYEHWAVSSWFGKHLAGRGENVKEFMGLTVWCRGCTGQSAYVDSCVRGVASDMGILAGQENSWHEPEQRDRNLTANWRVTVDYGDVYAERKLDGVTVITPKFPASPKGLRGLADAMDKS